MKTLALIIVLALSAMPAVANVVTGSVLLDAGTDHSGISVRFSPASPSAVESVATTNAAGEFSASVAAGVYDVIYFKIGFRSVTVNDVFVSGDMVIPQTPTLSSTPVVEVGGNVDGVWTADNSYLLTSSVQVPAGSVLTIEAGTKVEFNGVKNIIVNGGKLVAKGTKHAPILFTSMAPNKHPGAWGMIDIHPGAVGAEFSWCIMEYGGGTAEAATVRSRANLTMDNCTLQYSSTTGLIHFAYQNDLYTGTIKNCLFTHCSTGLLGDWHTVVEDSEFAYNNLGANLRGNAIFKRDKVHHSSYGGVSTGGDVQIENCILYNNKDGLGFGITVDGFKPTIRNNTFYNNKDALVYVVNNSYLPGGTVSSNIFSNNTGYALFFHSQDRAPDVVEYNQFFENSNFFHNAQAGFGNMITQNANGVASDTYYNFIASPDFFSTNETDPNFLYLNPTSAAIDAGDPSATDPDGSVGDCGAYHFQKYSQEITFNEIGPLTFGDDDVTLEGTSTSGLPVSFGSNNEAVATVTGNVLKITGAGTVEVVASQPGNTNFKPAEPVTQIVIIAKAEQSIDFELGDQTLGSPPVTLTGTTTSALPISFTSPSDKLTIDGSIATLIKAGRATITATQPGNGNYLEASPVDVSFCIKPTKPVITPTTLLTSTTSQLTSSNENGNQWYFNGTAIAGATSNTYLASESGSYTVVTTADDCVSESSAAAVLLVVSLENDLTNIEVYPNPVQDYLYIHLPQGDYKPAHISLIDVYGREIESRKAITTSEQFNISTLANGHFYVRIKVGDGTVVKRLVKN